MPSIARVVSDPHEAGARVGELGLTIDVLASVARHYGLSVANMTEDHPTWGIGITPASEAVFALRQQMRPLGWSRSDDRGFALTVHPTGLLAINIAKGDENTGNPENDPQSASEKGICTEEAVLSNQLSFSFWDAEPPRPIVTSRRPTWYLLLRVSKGKILCELSLPVAMSDDRHIASWAERIILPPLTIGEPEGIGSRHDVQEVTPQLGRRQAGK